MVVLLAFSQGCKPKYRMYSVALLDRSPQTDIEMDSVAVYFEKVGLTVMPENEVESMIEPQLLLTGRMKLCAGARKDRLDGAVSFGKGLGVDAIVFSSMPPVSQKIREEFVCLTDSLISLYLVEPPTVLIEAHTYEEFINQLNKIDWRTVVKPPPKPVEFTVGLNEKISFAGLKITVEKKRALEVSRVESSDDFGGTGGEDPAQFGKDIDGAMLDKERKEDPLKGQEGSMQIREMDKKDAEKQGQGEIQTQRTAQEWNFVISEGYHVIREISFAESARGRIEKRLEYEIKIVIGGSEPRFKAILTDLRP